MNKKGKSMTSPKGMCSYSKNPLKQAKQVKSGTGPSLASPANPDQAKIARLGAKAYREKDSHRGMNGI